MLNTSPRLAYFGDQLVLWGPKVFAAIVILVATYLIAKGARWALERAIRAVPWLSQSSGRSGQALAAPLGALAYWLVWLIGLLAAMQPLGLVQAMAPINALTNEVLSYLPRVVAAGLIFVVGLVFAKIARNVVEAALSVVNLDRLASRIGVYRGASTEEGAAATSGRASSLSLVKVVGALVFTLIVIPVAIAALEALGISSLVSPIVAVLHAVLDAVPRVLAAALLLTVAFIIAQWVRRLLASTLASLGFDRVLGSIGSINARTKPSEVAATISLVAIMLFAAIEAADLMNFDFVAVMLAEVTRLGGQVVFGSVIIVVGVVLGRALSSFVGDAVGESGLPSILKYAIVALAVAIGLRFMGLANEIVNLAFGLILGSAAVACAIAFGLGGRESAHQLLQRWLSRSSPSETPGRQASSEDVHKDEGK